MDVEHALPLVLASSSPRRQELIRRLGVPFEIWSPPDQEAPLPHLPPDERPARWADLKARTAQEAFPTRVVLGADTAVLRGDHLLGKSADADEALAMLRGLQGGWHRVITGFALRCRHRVVCDRVITRVCFRQASDEELRSYIATGEPMDKAGAYAIQGLGSVFISAIEGDYFNVVGLPVARVYACLQEWGLVGQRSRGAEEQRIEGTEEQRGTERE